MPEQVPQAPPRTGDPLIVMTMTNLSNFRGVFNLDKIGFNKAMPGHTTDHQMVCRQEPRTAKKIGAGIGLPVQALEEVLVDREDLGYHLYSVLEDDTLARGMTHLLDKEYDMAGDRPMDPASRLQ